MPLDLTPLDALSLACFLAGWLGYNLVFDHLFHHPRAINQHLKPLRRAWMERMLERDNRISDAALIGHTIHSASFFASTTMLVIAALIGVLGGVDRAYSVIRSLSFAARTTETLFELKLFMLLCVFVFAFFRFTWAIRQYNYLCVLIGAAPLPPVPAPDRRQIAEETADMLSLAVTSFNSGMRAYYFAVALLAWFLNPLLLLLSTAATILVLLRRQFFSRTHRAISARADAILRDGRDERQ